MSDNYDKVSLLLPMNGANNGTEFPDYSPVPKTVTRAGTTLPTTSTAQSKYYGSSGFFTSHTGNPGVFMTRLAVNLLSGPGTGPFCIELYIYLESTEFVYLASTRTNSSFGADVNKDTAFLFDCDSTQKLRFTRGASPVTSTSTGTVPINEWVHIAVNRDILNNVQMFINGVSAITAFSVPNNFSDQHIHLLGVNGNVTAGVRYVNDFRITYASKYTSDFTPPARLLGTISNSAVGATKILDVNGDPAERTVIAVPRSAPVRVFSDVSNASGEFEIQAPAGVDHAVVALADEATLKNELAHRVIPV